MRPDLQLATRADHVACRAILRRGSRSFAAASWLLPRRARGPVAALYAFCRVADDAVDEGRAGPAAVAALQARLDRVYDGRPGDDPVDRAFADAVHAHAIPRAAPGALLEGLRWDAEGRRYETLGEVRAYGVRVAGSVGVMMASVLGGRSPEALARACDLGVAMQLTNIARDVGEDARRGRLYLPRAWLREAGVEPDAWMAAPTFTPALGEVVARLLGEADALYARADAGVALLPRPGRASVRAARLVYADIGRALRRAGLDSVTRRARTSSARKLWLLVRALLGGGGRSVGRGAPPLEEARPLLEEGTARPVGHR